MMLAVENALTDFEAELDGGSFRSLRDASERAGRLVEEATTADLFREPLHPYTRALLRADPAAGERRPGRIRRLR